MLKRICRIVLPFVALFAALGIYRLAIGSAQPPILSAPRATPWVIAPQHDEPLVASDAELLQVLARVVPPADPVNTNNFIHALRLWGPSATFDDEHVPSGQQMRDFFLDDAVFQKYAPGQPGVFERTHDGLLRARSFDDGPKHRTTSSYHSDDFLATLAETGTPLDTVLHLREGQASVRQLAESALLDFNLSKHEYEWSIIAYARYVFPQKRWTNKYGETITVDDLVNEILDHPPGVGPCNGLHRLEALVVLYRANEEAKVISPKTRQKMLVYMHQMSELLLHSQTDEGYWTRHWPRGAEGRKDEKATVYDRLLVTGHQLEWLALAPTEVQPPRENVIRAARWTLRTILEISDEDLKQHYGPFTHAARALCLWRGHEPGEIWAQRPAASATITTTATK
jgi:hypothetical protein